MVYHIARYLLINNRKVLENATRMGNMIGGAKG
uniref:Transposase n=1 Tax=Ascaris lumbricoides TaxID=6252 RepID=A0A0M3II32_ASCLU